MAEAGSPPQATGQPTKERIVKSELQLLPLDITISLIYIG